MKAARAGLSRSTCVREQIRHGAENAPFLQRVDARRAAMGKATMVKKGEKDSAPTESMREACEAYVVPRDA